MKEHNVQLINDIIAAFENTLSVRYAGDHDIKVSVFLAEIIVQRLKELLADESASGIRILPVEAVVNHNLPTTESD